tara:strand:- start:579 stop:797 length:219 start_codon:yes stop_codon:yes gene_type:complete
MELSEIILTLVGFLTVGSAWIIKSTIADVKEIENQIANMPKEYVLKDDYKTEIAEVKRMLGNIYDILREKND